MRKSQIILIALAIVLTIGLFQLPKVVVENEKLADPKADSQEHDMSMPDKLKNKIAQWRQNWQSSANREKTFNFADSLAMAYLNYQMIDSAIWFIDQMEEAKDGGEEAMRVVELSYLAFQRASGREKAKELGEVTAARIEPLLEANPESSNLKNMLAMTMVVTDNPMQGVQMLRELLEENPDDRQALKNLGVLSIQSGQYQKAEERFETLLAKDSTDMEALFYLGVALSEQGKERGRKILEELAANDQNPAIQALAQGYLEN